MRNHCTVTESALAAQVPRGTRHVSHATHTHPQPGVIATAAALEELLGHLAGVPALGLDTEFLRERTYFARLCLLQIADRSRAECIDPLAGLDLRPIGALLASPATLKVMHAARQDVEVLLPLAGAVRPIFDTQVAAALTGMPAQVGYAELVRRLLGVELAKSHTRTDWSRRPLSTEQVHYALDDVRHLLPLRDILGERLDALGRTGWLREELAALEDPAAWGTDPEQAWRRVRGLAGLDPGRIALARSLGAWRERRALEKDRPRGWILEDAVLREIVLRLPLNPDELAAIPEMPPAVVRNCGAELLALVAAVHPAELPPVAERRPRPDPAQLARVRRLAGILQQQATALALSPELLATRRDLEQLAEGQREVAPLRGWRREAIGEALLAAL